VNAGQPRKISGKNHSKVTFFLLMNAGFVDDSLSIIPEKKFL